MPELDKTDDVVEDKGKPISELRVHELKAELEKRSLSSAGVKAVLTARLNKALRDEGINTEEHRFFVNRTPTTSPTKPRGRPSAKVADMSESKPEVEEKKVVEEEDVAVENVIAKNIESSPEPDELRIVEDSFEHEEHVLSTDAKDKETVVEEPKIEEPKVEEPKAEEPPIKEPVVNEPSEHEEKAGLNEAVQEKPEDVEETKEPVDEKVVEPSEKSAEEKFAEPIKEPETVEEPTPIEEKIDVPTAENVEADKKIDEDDEEVEGEDEFEEIEPEREQKEQKSVENSQSSPADDEIFLEEEDMLEDPLDEPVTESKTSTTTSIVTANAHIENSSASDTSLFGEEAKKTSIWIRGMTPSTKASSVKQLASQFGKVIQSKIFNSKPINGEIKNCFALVTFVESESMETAISTLHRKEHDGRILRVEKVSDSHLTGTAERIAKENEEKKKKEEEAKRQEQRKKRAVIQAPESPKKARQTIQAPEPSKKNRAIIQAPERSRSRERQRERKPITYESSKEETKKNEKKNEPDSRRIIAPARGSRVTPPRSSRGRDEHHQPSLIISARVDTSGCRGGPIKRSVERTVPSNISTSELRRKQPQNPQSRSFSRSRVDFPEDGDHFHHPRRGGRSPQPHLQQYSSRNEHYSGPIVYHDSRDRRDNSRGDREREKQREREMIEIIRRKEEEHRIREEKLQIEREREKMRFEQEKLERAKLELELTKQKLALQQAAAYARRATSGDRSRGEGSSSRRRHIEDTHSTGPRAKVHVDDRRGGATSSRRDATGARHATIPSARHVATEYGIQSNLGNSTSSLQSSPAVRVNNYSPSKAYDQRTSSNYRNGGNSYEMSNNYQGYQSTVPNRYGDNSYQQQVWAGLDSNGQMTMETHWTADSASASSSTTSNAGWQQQQYSNNNSSSNRNGRDYGYTRNHY